MNIINASAEIIAATDNMEQLLELAGRVCYKSEDRITPDSATAFIGRMAESKHESVLEHAAITVRVICDRGVSHELVRHRLASFSQESTRYVNYGQEKHGGGIQVIDLGSGFDFDLSNPEHADRFAIWEEAMHNAETSYLAMLSAGATPQEARSILPNSTKTEVIVTANPREWKHIFRLRCSPQAHPQMREIMIPLRELFAARWPALFTDH